MTRASVSSARAKRAVKSARPTRRRREIDFSEIPQASAAQLRAMRRVGRPPLGAERRRPIAIRIDPTVLGRKFVELHGGRIWVKSQLDEGSTFKFAIPVRHVE